VPTPMASALSSAVELERCDEAHDERRCARCRGGGSRCASGRVVSEDRESSSDPKYCDTIGVGDGGGGDGGDCARKVYAGSTGIAPSGGRRSPG